MTNVPAGDERLAEIRARVEAATPGPWKVDDLTGELGDEDKEWCGEVAVREGCSEDDCEGHITADGEYTWVAGPAYNEAEGLYWNRADAAFVACAREDVPYLLQRIEELTEVVGRSVHEAVHVNYALMGLCEEGGVRFRDGRRAGDEDLEGSGRVMLLMARVLRGMPRPRHQPCCHLKGGPMYHPPYETEGGTP